MAAGIIREANRRALVLLRTPRSFLLGRPLVSHVDDRWAFHIHLSRLGDGDAAEWTMRLQPRGGRPVQVMVVASPVRDPDGAVTQLRAGMNAPPLSPTPAARCAPASSSPASAAGPDGPELACPFHPLPTFPARRGLGRPRARAIPPARPTCSGR